jgi:hypothetical protein
MSTLHQLPPGLQEEIWSILSRLPPGLEEHILSTNSQVSPDLGEQNMSTLQQLPPDLEKHILSTNMPGKTQPCLSKTKPRKKSCNAKKAPEWCHVCFIDRESRPDVPLLFGKTTKPEDLICLYCWANELMDKYEEGYGSDEDVTNHSN